MVKKVRNVGLDLRKMNDRQKIEITVKPLVKVGRTVSGAVWFFYLSVSIPLKKTCCKTENMA